VSTTETSVSQPMPAGMSLVSGDFWAGDPHAVLTWMRRNEPIYWDELGGIWGVTRHADVKDVERQPELFSNTGGIRPDTGPIPMMIDMDDPEHAQRRKLVSRGFTPRSVRASEPAIRAACTEIIDAVAARGECDFVNDIAAPLPMIMIGDALGVAPEDRAQLLTWSDDLLKGLTGLEHPELMEKTVAAFSGFTEYMSQVIPAKRAHPTDDLISTLVHAEVDGERLDLDSLIHESLLILIGGDETTRHVISGGMYQLLRHPDQRRLLTDEPERIPVAVEEMLRWVTPIKNMARTVTRDMTYRGRELRAGQKMLMLYPSANRDEDVFDDPFRFDVTRHPNDHLAFGFGVHFCMGSNLARTELRVMFEEVLRRLPDLELVDDAEPSYRAANFVSGYESMPVRFTPTRPSARPR
jgi:cytochrome P450 family 142 subfamily A polypeptide 1